MSMIDIPQAGLLAPVLLVADRGKKVGEVQKGLGLRPPVDTLMTRHQSPLHLLGVRGPQEPIPFNSTCLHGLLSVPGGIGINVPIVTTPQRAVLSCVTIPIVVLR